MYKAPRSPWRPVAISTFSSFRCQKHMERERARSADASGTTEGFHRAWKTETMHAGCSPKAHLPLEWIVWGRLFCSSLSGCSSSSSSPWTSHCGVCFTRMWNPEVCLSLTVQLECTIRKKVSYFVCVAHLTRYFCADTLMVGVKTDIVAWKKKGEPQ